MPDFGPRQQDMNWRKALNLPKVWPRMSFPLAWAKLTSASAAAKLKLFWEPVWISEYDPQVEGAETNPQWRPTNSDALFSTEPTRTRGRRPLPSWSSQG